MRKTSQYAGFTLLEIVIAIAILVFISTITMSALNRFGKIYSLSTAGDKLTASLNEAKMLSLSSDGSRRFGIHLESDKIILFPESYVEGNSENKVLAAFDNGIKIGSINIGGGNEVIFEKLSGETSNFGTIVIRGPESKTITIKIEKSGNIEILK